MGNKTNIVYVFLAACIIAAIYFYNPFALYFQSDDFTHIAWSSKGILLQDNAFRPLCDLSIMLDYFVYGKNAWGYHLTNLLLHIIAAVLAGVLSFTIINKYFPSIKEARLFAFSCSSVFFIYATHSEAVFWILGRSAILGAIFSFIFLWAYLQKYQSRKFVIWYVVTWILALMSYESSWVLPLFCFLFCLMEKEKSRWKHVAIIWGIFLIFLVIRYFFIHQILGNYEGEDILNGKWNILASRFSILVIRSFLPWYKENLIAFYGLILLLLFCCITFFRLKKEKKKILFVTLYFLISLLPYISLGVDTNGVEGERFLYLPTFFGCFLLLTIVFSSPVKKYGKAGWLLLFCFFHLRVLRENAGNQQFAGDTVKLILTEIRHLPAKAIFVAGLPQCQYGALIFRTGLPEAVAWLDDPKKGNNIHVLSIRSELLPLVNPYNIVYQSGVPKDTACIIFGDRAMIVYK